MKSILILLFSLLTIYGYSQDDELVTVPSKVIVDAANKILEYQRTDSIKTLQIFNLKQQLFGLETINNNNLSIIQLKDKEIEIYKGAIKNIVPSPQPQPTKIKWYETPAVNYIAGVLTGGVLIYVGANLIY
jgi:hypothetical protein